MNSKRLKLLSAVLGAGVLITMGAVTMANGEQIETSSPDTSTGETITKSTAPSEPETTIATPPVTATPFGGAGA